MYFPPVNTYAHVTCNNFFDENLERKYNVTKQDFIDLKNNVFGKSGLVNADDTTVFDLEKFVTKNTLSRRRNVKNYFITSLLP